MALGTESGCINHPAIEAIGRCKQCGKPFCSTCRIQGPTGNFCSEPCKVSHEEFIGKAQQLDQMSRSGGFLTKLWYLGKKIVVFALFALAVAVALHFVGLEIPVVSDLIIRFMGS